MPRLKLDGNTVVITAVGQSVPGVEIALRIPFEALPAWEIESIAYSLDKQVERVESAIRARRQ